VVTAGRAALPFFEPATRKIAQRRRVAQPRWLNVVLASLSLLCMGLFWEK